MSTTNEHFGAFPPADPADPEELQPGAVTGEYVIEGMIAQGGCGAIYLARHPETNRRAAVKLLHASLATWASMVERFRREVEVVNLLGHPNIVEIYDFGVIEGGRPYYVMEYLAGRTLDALIQRTGRLSPAEALDVLEPVCSALTAAHQAGIIHRDIKASNIFVVTMSQGRVVKLLDFGIAKLIGPSASTSGLTSVGRRMGTLSAMAPEQILGGKIDARTDVYALGVLLHKMLTGRAPFRAGSDEELVRLHLEEPAPRPSKTAPMAHACDAVVLRCMEKRPERRYESAAELLRALQEALGVVSGERQSRPEVSAPAAGICLEMRLATDDEDPEETLIDDMERVLDMAEHSLASAGFDLPMSTGSTLLGVRLLSGRLSRLPEERRAAVDVARSLYGTLAARPSPDSRLKISVCVHVDEVLLRGGARPEIVGGALVRTSGWTPPHDASGLFATREAIEGVPGLEVVASAGMLVALLPARTAPPPRGDGRGLEVTLSYGEERRRN